MANISTINGNPIVLKNAESGLSNLYIADAEPVSSITIRSGLNMNTGNTASVTNRARTTALDCTTTRRRAVQLDNSNYQMQVNGYSSGTLSNTYFLGRITDGWITSDRVVYIPDDVPYIGCMFKKNDDSEFASGGTDAATIKADLKFFQTADATLATSGAAADAKAVGDAIAALGDEAALGDAKAADGLGNLYPLLAEQLTEARLGSGINMTTGATTSRSNRARSLGVNASTSGIRAVSVEDADFLIQVVGYSSTSIGSSTYMRRITQGWIGAGELVYIPKDIPAFGIMYAKADDSDFDDESTDAADLMAATALYGVAQGGTEPIFTADDRQLLVPTAAGVLALYDALVAAYPSRISRDSVTRGGVTLYEYTISSGDYNLVGQRTPDTSLGIHKPIVLICAGVHGYERSAVMSLYVVAKALLGGDLLMRQLAQSLIIKLVPVVCASGYDANSRLNSNGVNINRNFDSSSWVLSPTGNDYSGPTPASEGETQALQAWIDANTDAALYVDWHNSSYEYEASCSLMVGTDSDAIETKRSFLRAIDAVIPHWRDVRTTICTRWCYTGKSTAPGSSVSYATDKGLRAMTLETSWDVVYGDNQQIHRHLPQSIGLGAEAGANMLLGMLGLIEGD